MTHDNEEIAGYVLKIAQLERDNARMRDQIDVLQFEASNCYKENEALMEENMRVAGSNQVLVALLMGLNRIAVYGEPEVWMRMRKYCADSFPSFADSIIEPSGEFYALGRLNRDEVSEIERNFPITEMRERDN